LKSGDEIFHCVIIGSFDFEEEMRSCLLKYYVKSIKVNAVKTEI